MRSITVPSIVLKCAEAIFSEGEKPGPAVRTSLGLAAESTLLRQRGRCQRIEQELCDNMCIACELRPKHPDQFIAGIV